MGADGEQEEQTVLGRDLRREGLGHYMQNLCTKQVDVTGLLLKKKELKILQSL